MQIPNENEKINRDVDKTTLDSLSHLIFLKMQINNEPLFAFSFHQQYWLKDR